MTASILGWWHNTWLRDLAGNQVASFTNSSVTNNTPVESTRKRRLLLGMGL